MAQKAKAYERDGKVVLSRAGATMLDAPPGNSIGRVEGTRGRWSAFDDRGREIGWRKNKQAACHLLYSVRLRRKLTRDARNRFADIEHSSPTSRKLKALILERRLPAGERPATFALVELLRRCGCSEIRADNGVPGDPTKNCRVPGTPQFRRADVEAVTADGVRVYVEVKTHTGMERPYSADQIEDQRILCRFKGWMYVLVVVDD